MAFADGYTMIMKFQLDGLAWVYISIAIAWTILLGLGVAFLISKRHRPFLRIRNVPLAVSAVATLHVYWVLCMIAYVLQGFFPCGTEYWIMSVYLPLGIALFQACNTQLLHVANIQRRYATSIEDAKPTKEAKYNKGWRKWLPDLYANNRAKRTMKLIAYGMVLQIVIATVVFFISRKFHSNFGLVGPRKPLNEKYYCHALVDKYQLNDPSYNWPAPVIDNQCAAAKKIECRRGAEWAPSVIWQVFWSWCYAPYLLWQVRDINDVHGWRKQTTYCCLAGLFATPMWLCALYINDMYRMNKYFVPPLWFAPTIFLIEAFLVFVPCWQVVKNNRLQADTLDIINEWQAKRHGNSFEGATVRAKSRASKQATTSSTSSRNGQLYTMEALMSTIRTEPQKLLLFAALKDFSGENISFLIQMREWKWSWTPSSPVKTGFIRRPSVHDIANPGLQRQQFQRAVDIYASYISPRYSDYPLNLSHTHLKELEAIFEGAAMVLYGYKYDDSDSNSATPFEDWNFKLWPTRSSSDEDIEAHKEGSISSHKTLHNNATHNTDFMLSTTEFDPSKRHTVLKAYEMSNMATEQLPEFVPVPEAFGPDVFDHAEESIKYMVLTNTWPKFVNDGYATAHARKKNWGWGRMMKWYA